MALCNVNPDMINLRSKALTHPLPLHPPFRVTRHTSKTYRLGVLLANKTTIACALLVQLIDLRVTIGMATRSLMTYQDASFTEGSRDTRPAANLTWTR